LREDCKEFGIGGRSDPIGSLQGHGVLHTCLGVGEGVCCPVPCQSTVVHRLLPRLALGKVMGEFLIVVGQAVGIKLFDRIPHGIMEFPAPLHQEALIGHILDHGMLEDVCRLREAPLLVDDL
jgi:hypothetical protein